MTVPRTRAGNAAAGALRRTAEGFLPLLALLAFPFLILLAFLSSLLVLPQLANLPPPQLGNSTAGLAGFNLPQRANDTMPALVGTSTPLLPIPETWLLAILAGLAVAAVGYIVLRAYGNRARNLDFMTDTEGTLTEEKRREVAEILDEAASELVLGADYRDTVLRCYRLICEVLERESKISGRKLTAREFTVKVSEQLGLGSAYLPRATELFELARYSDLEITRSQALEAADCLSNLSASVRGASPRIGVG
jgi:hypothetical protein